MRTSRWILIALTVVSPILTTSPASAQASPAAEAEIRSVLARVAEAASKLDVEAMGALRARDLVSVAGGREPVGYGVWIKQLRDFYATLRSDSGDFRWGSTVLSFVDSTTATVAATWSFSAVQKDGQKLEVQGAETYVLALREGRWLIVHQHESYRS